MSKVKIFIASLFVLAAALILLGNVKGESRPEEAIFLKKLDVAGDRVEPGAGALKVLDEVMRYARMDIEETAAELGNDPREALTRLDKVFQLVRQQRNVHEAEAGDDPVTFIRSVVEGEISSRAWGYYKAAMFVVFLGLAAITLRMLNLHRKTKEKLIHTTFMVLATTSVLVLFLIMCFLFKEGLPVFQYVSIPDFIFGKDWYPTDEPPALGILPLIMGSVAVTALSSVIAIPLGVMTAIYMAEIARPNVRAVIKPTIELLASLPSVVIGFFGMVVVAPWLQQTFGIPTGLNLLNASVMLAFMSVPTITSVSEDAIYAVPTELKEASLALGATHFETMTRVIVPASLSGISTAVILGMSRSIGETMVVLMVAGGAGLIPDSIFDPVRPMPASIAAEMGEAPYQTEHYYALFAIGVVLFLFTLLFNIVADHIAHKYKQVGAATL